MKIKNILIGLAAVVMSTVSCSKWFDVSPSTNIKDKDLFKNEQGFKDVLTGVYQLMSSTILYGKDLTYGYNDVRAQYWRFTAPAHDYYYALNYDYSNIAEVNRTEKIWNTLYKAISNLNIVLNNIDNNKSVFSKGNYELLKGEALALRAMLHFDIMRLYSPLPTDGVDQKAIPYYIVETNISQPQLTIKEVIDMARQDLNSARNLMREVDVFGPNYSKFSEDDIADAKRNIKMNYWAATALLARIELYGGNRNEALVVAKEIVSLPTNEPVMPFVLSTSGNSGDKLFSKENIFVIDVQKLKDYTEKIFIQNGATTTSTTHLPMTIANKNSLYALSNPSDLEYRKLLWMIDYNASSTTLSKYQDEKIIPLIKLSEVYYIAAECETDTNMALNYLNKIRAARGLSPLPASSDLIKELEKEYKRDFIGEGQLFFYYKRNGTLKIGLNNKTVNKSVYVLPLPKNEIEFGKIE